MTALGLRGTHAIIFAVFAFSLVWSGCESNVQDTKITYTYDPEMSPLMNAALAKDLGRAKNLIQKGVNVNERDKYGQTALTCAFQRQPMEQNLPIVKALVQAGADINEDGVLMHSLTADGANTEVTVFLINQGARIEKSCGSSDSLVSLAAQDGSADAVRALVARGAPVDCRDKYGRSALYWAATNGEADLVELLIRSGADPTVKDGEGQAPLDAATTTSSERRVQAKFARTREVLRRRFAN